MKTVIIAHNYMEQTVAAMSYNLAHYLTNNNYKVIFISHRPFFEKKFVDRKVSVYSWPTAGRPTGFKDAIWFAKIILKNIPDVIISHFGSVNITVMMAKLLSFGKIKTLPYYHTVSKQLELDTDENMVLKKLKKFRKYLIYKLFCDKIICPSEVSRLDLVNYFKIKKGIKIVNPMNDRFQETIVETSNEIIISYLGRINKSKGVFILLEAFNYYCTQHKTTKIRLHIAGSGSDVVEFNEILNKIENPNITYIGGIKYDEIDTFLKKGSYTIIPSLCDNLPTVGLESLMNGVPLLISKSTGLTLELEENVYCITFNSTVKELLYLFRSLENNKYDYAMLKINARKIYLKKFDVEQYCNAIVNLIENN